MENSVSTSQILINLAENHKEDRISIGQIKTALHERSFAVLLFVFALPLVFPIPTPPGYTTILSIPLLFLSVQMLFSAESPWFPKWFSNKSMKTSSLKTLVTKSVPYIKKIESFMRRRYEVFNTGAGEKIFGLFCLLFAISIAIPLPLTNFIPAIGICVMSLGLISRDGVIVTAGIIVGMIGIVITSFVLYAFFYGAKELKSQFPKEYQPVVEEIYKPVSDSIPE